MLVEYRDPRETGIIDIECKMKLCRPVAEQVGSDGAALHHLANLLGIDPTRWLAADFQPDSVKDRRRDAACPGQRKNTVRGIECVTQQTSCLFAPLLDEADRQELGMLLHPDGEPVHVQPQEFRPFGDGLLAVCDQEFIDIGEDVASAAFGQEDIANETAGTFKFVKGAGVKLVGKAAPEGVFFHGGGSCN